MRGKFALFVVAMMMIASASAGFLNTKKPVLTSLHYFQYNKFAEGHLGSPASVKVQKYGSSLMLYIDGDRYDPTIVSYEVMISQNHVDDYLSGVAKYQEWAAKAAEAGDVFEKDIGKYKVVSGQSLKMSFYGFQKGKYYLVLTPCLLFKCESDSSLLLDEKGAVELTRLLTELKSGTDLLDANKSTADKYN